MQRSLKIFEWTLLSCSFRWTLIPSSFVLQLKVPCFRKVQKIWILKTMLPLLFLLKTTPSLVAMPPVVYPLEMIFISSISLFIVLLLFFLFFFFFFFFSFFFKKGPAILDHFKFIQVHLARPCLQTSLDTIALFRLNSLKGFWTIIVCPFYLWMHFYPYCYCQI